MTLFKLENISYSYPQAKMKSLININLHIDKGDFIVVMGPSGGGKSTLIRLLGGLIPHFYGGKISGQIYYDGKNYLTLDQRERSGFVGTIFQDPEKQLIMGQVERDIALGLENLGVEQTLMKERVEKILSLMKIGHLRTSLTNQISSGEQQKVAIGSILAMKPDTLILDEPTSQLDPQSAKEVIDLLHYLNQVKKYTIILIEHQLNNLLDESYRYLYIDESTIECDSDLNGFLKYLSEHHEVFLPLTLRYPDGKIKKSVSFVRGSSLVNLEQVRFQYDRKRKTIEDISLTIHEGEFVHILGDNGAGKSTLLKLMAGIIKPDEGKVISNQNQVMYLSQNPDDYLFEDTVESELRYTLKNFDREDDGSIDQTLNQFDLLKYKHKYPRELSGGERQRLAIAALLIAKPKVLLLDEPTRGLDQQLKIKLGLLLQDIILTYRCTIVLVTQDIEFAAEFAGRVIQISQGRMVRDDSEQKLNSQENKEQLLMKKPEDTTANV